MEKTLWGFNEESGCLWPLNSPTLPHSIKDSLVLSFGSEKRCIVFECLLWSTKVGLLLPKPVAGCSTVWNAGKIDGLVISAHDAADPGEGQQKDRIEEGSSHTKYSAPREDVI